MLNIKKGNLFKHHLFEIGKFRPKTGLFNYIKT